MVPVGCLYKPPNMAEIQQQVQQQMLKAEGRVPKRDTPVTTDGIEVVISAGHGKALTAVALSPNGRYILSSSRDGSAKLWDVVSGQVTHEFPVDDSIMSIGSQPHHLSFSDDGRQAIVRDYHGVRLYDVATGHAIQASTSNVMRPTVSREKGSALSPDGQFYVTESAGSEERLLIVTDTATGRTVQTIKVEGSKFTGGLTNTLTFSPDGKNFARSTSDSAGNGTAQVWEVPSWRLAATFRASAVNFSHDGRTLVVGLPTGGPPFLRDMVSGKETHLMGGASGVTDLAMGGNGQLVVVGMDNGSAKLWDLTTGHLVRTFDCPGGSAVMSVAVSPTSPLVATGCLGGSTLLWDLTTGRQIQHLSVPLPMDQPMATMVRISRDGRTVVWGVNDQLMQWDLASGKEMRRITLPPGVFRLPGFENPFMESSRKRLTNVSDKSFTEFSEKGATRIVSLAIHPNGQFVAVGRMQDVSLWDMKTGQQIRKFDRQQGATSLVFSPDGRILLTKGFGGNHAWDWDKGEDILDSMTSTPTSSMATSNLMNVNDHTKALAVSADSRIAARGYGRVIKVWDLMSGKDLFELTGHTSDVESLAFAPNSRVLVSGGGDGAARLWDLQTGKELAALVSLGRQDSVIFMPDQYYLASKASIKGVAFQIGEQRYPFEQFDLRFNRPDIVLQRLGHTSSEVVQSYRLAYEKRLKKMGFTEQMLKRDFHLPEVEVLTKDVPVSLPTPTLTLRVKASDSEYPLDRLHVFVNDIPIYGTAGLPLPAKQLKTHEQDLQVPLVAGRNKVQVSVLNQQGVESLKQTVYTSSTAPTAPPDVYVVAIGVSDYKNKAYSLRYAAKDALDLVKAYQAIEQRPGSKTKVHVLNLTDQKATRPEILKAKDWLRQSKINDLVVVFAAGHGMTDEQSNYYFGTHDIDPQHPATSGLPYEDFENLLDGIPALQKVLLLDTCFSGEIEKDQAVVVAKAETGGAGTVKMRAFKAARGVTVTAGTSGAPTGTAGASQLSQNMVTFQQDWFADLRRGTGAAVISSSSGNEYSLEGEQWKNGVFTYALLNGLKNHGADANKDQTVTVSELQGYVIDQVRTLTQGGQNPTVRHENLEYDFAVY